MDFMEGEVTFFLSATILLLLLVCGVLGYMKDVYLDLQEFQFTNESRFLSKIIKTDEVYIGKKI